ncbi:hypothetical protein [uncultured Bifidobacterium sp.]|uniref:hypothetical protein n=1 Tax=uncultured Bifidobacterium sp. TaxID=165187 RepID=UPI0025923DA1|nr:hypothetical protein [uncultured Bifidobacterium sp.]
MMKATSNPAMAMSAVVIRFLPSLGTNEISSLVLPLVIKEKSAGIMGSLRSRTLHLLATA